MGLIIFILCLVIVFRRQWRNVTLVVPAVIGGIGLLGTILTLVSFVGTLEAVTERHQGAGIGTLLDAEEFRLDQLVRDRRAIHGDE